MSNEDSTLSLSDDEFSKLPIPSGDAEPVVADTPAEEVVEAQEPSEEVPDTQAAPTEEKPVEEPVEASAEVVEELDYKKVYEEIFKPFKANGKEMTVDNIEDVRQLMQMGANYNKKMAGLKPNLKLIKMLENNDLLDESKLSYLIDINKHNPDAIKKLIKESGLDPLDVDISAEVAYKANTYNVNDKELELDSVLSEIKETDTFNDTLDIIGNKWDDSSKKVLLDNPGLIKVINTHVGSGVYKTITSEVERQRMLGKLDGLSDIDAYKAVGDVLYAPRANAPQNTQSNSLNTSTSKAPNKTDPQLKDRKMAASTTKSVSAGSTKQSFNPLSMSDAEFEKIASSKYI
jgi:hypothetical protein